ncbi:MAG: TetR/AcrR family transcriptional regulator [Phycisphaeraceae bacterium]|nr:TetR/AcrR family transcriptional regulator [Phycisphaeraceae bacterium]
MPESTPSRNHNESKPNTKLALLDAAEQLFGERGYEAVGIREIVDLANANLAAIKYHFGSKRDLYNEVVGRVLDRARADGNIWDALIGPFESPLGACEALGAFIGMHCLRVLQGGSSARAARLFLMEAMWPSEAFNDVIEEHFRPCMKRMQDVISRVNPGITETEAATLAESVMGPMVYQRIYRKIIDSVHLDGQPIEQRAIELAERLTRFDIRGIGGDPAMQEAAISASREAVRAACRRAGQGTEKLPT